MVGFSTFPVLCSVLASFASASNVESSPLKIIPGDFVDKHRYRIERQRLSADDTFQLLNDLIYHGIPAEGEDGFPKMALKKIGYAGTKIDHQHKVEDYGTALQNFIKPEHHLNFEEKHSLLYLLEQLEGPSRVRTNSIISDFASESILKDGGSAHLYMSAPGMAALDNHTDTTDIVVLQLDGAKEWLLCTAKNTDEPSSTPIWNKLNSCSTYRDHEMESLECERTTLYPGDVLFLPRRVVHSAQALSDTYSAHLTFGYNDDIACTNFAPSHSPDSPLLRQLRGLCDGYCDDGCDGPAIGSSCDESCNSGCDYFSKSCDENCSTGCDETKLDSCDESCDHSCDPWNT